MDGAGRWAATCSVLPGDSWELPTCSGLFSFSLFLKTSIPCQWGAITWHPVHLGQELKLGSEVGKGETAESHGDLEPPGGKVP